MLELVITCMCVWFHVRICNVDKKREKTGSL